MELAELMLQRTDYARRTLTALPGVGPSTSSRWSASSRWGSTRRSTGDRPLRSSEGVNPGYALGRDHPEYEDGLLVAITEQRSRADIDRLADVLGRAVAAESRSASLSGARA